MLDKTHFDCVLLTSLHLGGFSSQEDCPIHIQASFLHVIVLIFQKKKNGIKAYFFENLENHSSLVLEMSSLVVLMRNITMCWVVSDELFPLDRFSDLFPCINILIQLDKNDFLAVFLTVGRLQLYMYVSPQLHEFLRFKDAASEMAHNVPGFLLFGLFFKGSFSYW